MAVEGEAHEAGQAPAFRREDQLRALLARPLVEAGAQHVAGHGADLLGRLAVEAIVNDVGRGIPVFDFHLAGTTGLRPMRGDPDDTSARTDEDRCTAPRHDEGWYVGRVERKALVAFAKELGDVDGVIKMLRTLDRSVLAGTFEGHLAITPDAESRLDYCDIEKGAWWFDGLLAWDARSARVKNHSDDAAGAK